MKKTALSLLVFTLAGVSLASAQVTVTWQNTANALFLDSVGTSLPQGIGGTNSDGALIQLGYFTGQTGLGFAGSWTPLTGVGTGVTLKRTTIGDASNNNGGGGVGEGIGRFNFLTNFTLGTNVVDVYDPLAGDTGNYQTQSSISISLTTPPDTQVLSIRFFDTNAGTGNYNTVQSAGWVWHAPSLADPNPNVTIFINGPTGLSFQASGPLSDFRTVIPTIPIPEPTTFALLGAGLGFLLLRRRARV